MEALLRKIREYLRKHHNARQLRRTIMSLAMVVVFVTTYVLILPAITIDKDTAATDPAIIMDASAEENIQTATDTAEGEPAPETEAPEEVTQPETVELEPETNAPQAAAPQEEPKAEERQNETEKQKEAESTEKAENQKDEPRDTEAASDAKEEENVPVAGKATYKAEDFTITVTWDKDAGLMADTALNLQELIREERKEPTPYDYVNEEYYDGYVDGTRHALQKSIDKTVEIADVRFLQLYLTYEGQIVTPKNKVKVDIEYKKPVEKVEKTTIKAVHFDAEKEEPVVLPVKVKVKPGEDGAPDTIEKLRFETSRISFYGITYVQLNSEEAAEEQNETLTADEEFEEESSSVDETQDTDEKTIFYTEDEDGETDPEEGESEEAEGAEETAESEETEETTAVEETAETVVPDETEAAEEITEAEPITFTDLSTNVIVNVTAPADAFPEGTTMVVTPVDAGEVETAAGDLVNGQIQKVEAVDITFRNAEGEEIQPLKPIQVVMLPKTIANAEEATVVHVDGEGNADVVEAETEGAKVTFEAEKFSVYAIVYTVDFHWNVNGKEYVYSFPGGGFVSFYQLVEALGISNLDTQSASENENEAIEGENTPGNSNEDISNYSLDEVEVSEATKQFVADVANVEFSDPELVWIGKLENESTVGEIKEEYGLEVQYSAELTEEEIEEINSSTVEVGDWAVISMLPFATTESLIVTMKDGAQFTIRVTDAQNPVNLDTSGLSGFVTLDMFDYYGNNSNHNYDNLDSGSNHLTGTSATTGAVNDGINANHDLKFMAYGTAGANSINHFTGGTTIRQGIVQGTLDEDGYPKLASGSKESLSYLFEQSNGTGRKYYGNVQGLFYKGNNDGSYNANGSYYAYDSDRYYAYLNGSTIQHHTADIKIERTSGGSGSTVSDGTNGDPIGFFPFDPYNGTMTCPHPRDITWYNHQNHYNNHPSYNHGFGLSMSAQFEMPIKDGNGRQTVDGNDMIFSFSGDDDMWVFIDDVLVLDIGGIHHPSSGSINFTNGTVSVDNGVTGVNGATNGINQKYGRTNAKIEDIFRDAGRTWVTDGHSAHTIKVFYLERGGIYSNCKIVFNLPLILGKGAASIVKKDADPNNTTNEGKLEGAIFGLWTNPECTGDAFMTRVSGTNGMCTFADLSVGDDLSQMVYYMKELQAPYGYKLDDTVYQLKPIPDSGDPTGYRRDAQGNYVFQLLGQNGTSLQVLQQEPYIQYIPNEKAEPISLKVQKKWQSADNLSGYIDPPAGVTAKFRIKRRRSYDVVEKGSDDIHRIIKSVSKEDDEEFNARSNNVVELPKTNSATPWEYSFGNLTLAEEGSVTIGSKSYPVQFYYEYYIEESDTPAGYEAIYLDQNNQELAGGQDPSVLATNEDNKTQSIVNRELLDIPARKYWDDFSGDAYNWTATLQLDYRDIPIPSTGVNVNDIGWTEYRPRDEAYCLEISKAHPETEFADLPVYITKEDGKRYRREYSIVEVAYTVTRVSDNHVIFQYNKDTGVTIPQGDTYTPWFDHDAGEDDDYDDDNYPGADDYNIVVHNLRENRNIQKEIQLSIEKEWPDESYATDPDAKAVFRLRRYILTEFRNYEETDYEYAPKVTLILSDGTNTLETLTVPKGVPMSIHGYLEPKASGTITFDPGISYTANNQTSDHKMFDIEFTATDNMTITLTGGEDLVVGGASGFRFKEMAGTSSPEELDNSFSIEFELHNGHWRQSFPGPHASGSHETMDVLPAVEVSVLDASGNTANTYVYRYFFEEVECTPSSFNATFTDSTGKEFLGDEANQIYFNADIKATNRPTGLDLLKVDKDHPENVLPGAKFQMRKLAVDSETGKPYKASPNGQYVGTGVIEPEAEATDSSGKMVFKPENGLEPGYYEVLETYSPTGYVLLEDSAFYLKVEELGVIKLLKKDANGAVLWDEAATEGEKVGDVSISSSTTIQDGKTITVTVGNTRGVALPNTGGPGTRRFVLIGTALILLAAGIALLRRRGLPDIVAIRAADSRTKKNGKGGGGLL